MTSNAFGRLLIVLQWLLYILLVLQEKQQASSTLPRIASGSAILSKGGLAGMLHMLSEKQAVAMSWYLVTSSRMCAWP